jgi:hypothetical protein
MQIIYGHYGTYHDLVEYFPSALHHLYLSTPVFFQTSVYRKGISYTLYYTFRTRSLQLVPHDVGDWCGDQS